MYGRLCASQFNSIKIITLRVRVTCFRFALDLSVAASSRAVIASLVFPLFNKLFMWNIMESSETLILDILPKEKKNPSPNGFDALPFRRNDKCERTKEPRLKKNNDTSRIEWWNLFCVLRSKNVQVGNITRTLQQPENIYLTHCDSVDEIIIVWHRFKKSLSVLVPCSNRATCSHIILIQSAWLHWTPK